jgi:hypothetical protein
VEFECLNVEEAEAGLKLQNRKKSEVLLLLSMPSVASDDSVKMVTLWMMRSTR